MDGTDKMQLPRFAVVIEINDDRHPELLKFSDRESAVKFARIQRDGGLNCYAIEYEDISKAAETK